MATIAQREIVLGVWRKMISSREKERNNDEQSPAKVQPSFRLDYAEKRRHKARHALS